MLPQHVSFKVFHGVCGRELLDLAKDMKDVKSSIQNQSIFYEEGMVTPTFPTTSFTKNSGIHPNAIDADHINHAMAHPGAAPHPDEDAQSCVSLDRTLMSSDDEINGPQVIFGNSESEDEGAAAPEFDMISDSDEEEEDPEENPIEEDPKEDPIEENPVEENPMEENLEEENHMESDIDKEAPSEEVGPEDQGHVVEELPMATLARRYGNGRPYLSARAYRNLLNLHNRD